MSKKLTNTFNHIKITDKQYLTELFRLENELAEGIITDENFDKQVTTLKESLKKRKV